VHAGGADQQVAPMALPTISTMNYLSITLLKKMERAPEVLAVLDSSWGQVGGGADSIFDDFFETSGAPGAKQDQAKEI
jgi:hypothetical protein